MRYVGSCEECTKKGYDWCICRTFVGGAGARAMCSGPTGHPTPHLAVAEVLLSKGARA